MGHLVLSPSVSFYYPPKSQSEEVCAGVVEVSGFWGVFCSSVFLPTPVS